MKKVFFIFLVLLGFSRPAFPQIIADNSCQAEFEWKVNDMIMMFAPGMAVNFYGISKPDAENWFWDFGDGSFSEEQNPMHIFTFLNGTSGGVGDDGVFIPKVCLTVNTKDGCSSSVCKALKTYTDTIVYPDSACFVYFYPYRNDTLMSIPEVTPYSFKVSAPENTVSYMWDFGDGSVSEEANPIHSFNNMDPALSLYNVCLTITTSDNCTNSYCAPVYVGYNDSTVVPDCQAAYTYTVMESYPEQYAFQDLSMGNTTAWFWDFGDGTYSNEQNPVHGFWKRNDSLDASGYLGPPIADHYKVCLTAVSGDNCKSTYCDYVYMGGVVDTIFPQPCPYYISITTSNTLGGNFCNGKASASLVDAAGNSIEATDFYWSTGETGPSASGLCVNVPYYVSITGVEGCQVVGSFAIIDYNQSIDPFGYWTIYGNGSYYDLKYAVPDSGYTCEWEFSDGTTMNGENVKYAFDGSYDKSVTLNVLDASGNVVYSEQITLNQATAVKETKVSEVRLYPNPVVDELRIQLNGKTSRTLDVEIYNSLGQKRLSEHFTEVYSGSEISLSVRSLERGMYYARVLGAGNDPVTMSFVK
jgi:hypothetical protein